MRWMSICLVAALTASSLSAAEPNRADSEKTIKALEAVTATMPPEKIYGAFSDFCKVHFGAEAEPLMYDKLGKDLAIVEGGDWTHVSLDSASIGFETSLPAVSHVEWGRDAGYGQRSSALERQHFLHLHVLRPLQPDTEYHYRLVTTDERGNTVRSPDRTLRTRTLAGAVEIPGKLAGPPYKLTDDKTTYILTADLSVPGVAFEVSGDDITLDLNGHSVTFGVGATAPVPAGITANGSGKARIKYVSSGLKVLNGSIIQGAGPALDKNEKSEAFCPLVIKGADAEVAGVQITYHGPQVWGMTLEHPTGAVHLHHNVFTDLGALITNRHGSGTRAIGFRNADEDGNAFHFDHNLVRRTRQNGFGGATSMHNNEIYVDSWSTNSFAMQPLSKPGVKSGDLHHNRIFGTGFNAYGFGWAHESLKVHDNIVYFQGIMANKRWESKEDWGDLSCLEAMRVTNYGKGGQVRNDLEYWGNLIVLKGRGGCELRGTGFFSDTSIRNLVFRDNTVKVISEDAKTVQVACISAQGHYQKDDSQPVFYRGNTLISNLCHLRFGDSYGKGNNHIFTGNTLVREGAREDYHSIAFGGAFWNYGHRIIDTVLGKGTSLEDVFWQQTSGKSWYAVQWTLQLTGKAGTPVRILDSAGTAEFEGSIPDSGELRVPLTQAIIHPPTWPEGGEAKGVTGSKQEVKTPHQVLIGADGADRRSISMDRPQSIRL